MNNNEHVVNTICPFCGGHLYANYNTPDVIQCDTCGYEINLWDYVNNSDNNNMIKGAAHGSSGASELNACEA